VSDNAELHSKILAFLLGEWARQDNRQLIRVVLFYSPSNGFKDEQIREWVRTDEPELFADSGKLDDLVRQIIDIAEGEVDAKQAGKHRFIVRTYQFMGGRQTLSFALAPTYRGQDDLSLLSSGGGGGGGGSKDQQVIANHASQLMRINAQMFEGTIRVFGSQNMSLHEQVTTLTAENAMLRRELEEARSNKMDREFNLAMAAEKNARTNAGFQKVLQIGSVIAAKIGTGTGSEAGTQTPLAILLTEFYQSLRQEQFGVLMNALDLGQKMMFMEIVKMVTPSDSPSQQGSGAPASTP